MEEVSCDPRSISDRSILRGRGKLEYVIYMAYDLPWQVFCGQFSTATVSEK